MKQPAIIGRTVKDYRQPLFSIVPVGMYHVFLDQMPKEVLFPKGARLPKVKESRYALPNTAYAILLIVI
jgi:hypothetical protein